MKYYKTKINDNSYVITGVFKSDLHAFNITGEGTSPEKSLQNLKSSLKEFSQLFMLEANTVVMGDVVWDPTEK